MRFHALLAVALATTTLAAQTPAKRPMTFADLQAMKRISDPQISPSGKWVLFSVTDVSLEKNTKINHLWLVPFDGSAKEHQLTTGDGESNGRFSPDGKSVMYTAGDQISVAPWNDAAGTLGAPHAVTALATGADGGLWTPDSTHFLFTSSVYPECEVTILSKDRKPNSRDIADDIIRAESLQRMGEAQCNADKDAAASKSLVKAQIFDNLLYRHWNAYVGPKHSHIFYAAIPGADGKIAAPEDLTPASVVGDHEAPTFSLGGPLGYAISPDGKEVAYEVNLDKVPAESTNNDIFTLQLNAAPSTAKKVSTSPGSDDGPQYSPDGKWLGWRSQARAGFESDRFSVVVMDRATGATRDVLPALDASIDEFAWDKWPDHFVFTAARHGEENIYASVIPRGNVGTYPPALWARGAEFSSVSMFTVAEVPGTVNNEPNTIIAIKMSVDHPAELVFEHLLDHSVLTGDNDLGVTIVNAATVTPLTHLNDALLNQLDLPKMESFTFRGANATDVQGFLIRPPNFDPSKKYPLKFLIHGGPQGAWGDAWSYRWNPELFAANGYVVVMINPRGSTGYGQKFVDEVSGDWGGRPYFDLMKGLDYVEDKYPFIDKKRECALGASYGGFMAEYILTHTDRFACIVTHDGMYNPQSAFGTTEELWFNEWEFRPLNGTGPDATVEESKPAHPWDFYNLPADQDPFRKFSPMLAIDNAKTPTLVIHSQKDYRLDVSEGLQLFTALQLRNVPSKMLYFPDEGHWVQKPQNSQLWYQTVNDWVDRWTHTNAYEKK
jgi:dipeptidyl aminopeptidase/acylaminoacyl peptidase